MTDVLVEAQGPIIQIRMNRPRKRNALTLAMAERISAAVDRLDTDPQLRIGVLTGEGGTFCSGMDLEDFLGGETPEVGDRGIAGLQHRDSGKPLVAAVEGHALAGGLELMLCCDLVVAAENALLGIPEVTRGLVAGGGGVVRLPTRLPYYVAMELALTGQPIDARRAFGFGLVNRVSKPGGALLEAMRLAEHIVANGPLAVEVSRRVVAAVGQAGEVTGWELQDALLPAVVNSVDAIEGARAFVDKRSPRWQGR